MINYVDIYKPKVLPFINGDIMNFYNGKVYISPKMCGEDFFIFKNGEGNIDFFPLKEDMAKENIEKVVDYLKEFNNNYVEYFEKHPSHRLICRFIDKSSINEPFLAVIDVLKIVEQEKYNFIPFDEYVWRLDVYGIKYVPIIAALDRMTFSEFLLIYKKNKEERQYVEQNCGLMFKNYEYMNEKGQYIWTEYVD